MVYSARIIQLFKYYYKAIYNVTTDLHLKNAVLLNFLFIAESWNKFIMISKNMKQLFSMIIWKVTWVYLNFWGVMWHWRLRLSKWLKIILY